MEKEKINNIEGNSQPEKSEKERVNDEKSDGKRKNLVSDKQPERKEHERGRYVHSYLREVLGTTRPVKVTKGGRRFSFTSLILIKDKEKKGVAYARGRGKETINALQKAYRKAQKKLLVYFPTPPRTIPRDIIVDYKATRLILKPTPPGNGIKASGTLSTLFKYLGIKDVSIKIIGSRNKLNVIRAAFLALDKLTGKRYEY